MTISRWLGNTKGELREEFKVTRKASIMMNLQSQLGWRWIELWIGLETAHAKRGIANRCKIYLMNTRSVEPELSRGSLQTPAVLSVRQAGMLHCQHGSSERKVSPPDKRVRHQKLQWLRQLSLTLSTAWVWRDPLLSLDWWIRPLWVSEWVSVEPARPKSPRWCCKCMNLCKWIIGGLWWSPIILGFPSEKDSH